MACRASATRVITRAVSSFGAIPEQTLVAATRHRAAEVADSGCPDAARVTLALEEHGKAEERNLIHPKAVDSAGASSPGHRCTGEAGFAQQPLRQTLERLR